MKSQVSLPFITFVKRVVHIAIILISTQVSRSEATCDKYGDVAIGMDVTGSVLDGAFQVNTISFVRNLVDRLNETRFRTAVYPWIAIGYNGSSTYSLTSTLTKSQKLDAITQAGTKSYPSGHWESAGDRAVKLFNDPALPRRQVAKILVSATDGWYYDDPPAQKALLKTNEIVCIAVQIDPDHLDSGLLLAAQGVKSRVFVHTDVDRIFKYIDKVPCAYPPKRYLKRNETKNGTLQRDQREAYCFTDIEQGVTIDFKTDVCSITAHFTYDYASEDLNSDFNEGEVDLGTSFYPNEVPNSTDICVILWNEPGPHSRDKGSYSIKFIPGDAEEY